jgi:hypothetical protein
LVGESANGDRPPIGFCIESLLGSKYAGLALAALWRLPPLFEVKYLQKVMEMNGGFIYHFAAQFLVVRKKFAVEKIECKTTSNRQGSSSISHT